MLFARLRSTLCSNAEYTATSSRRKGGWEGPCFSCALTAAAEPLGAVVSRTARCLQSKRSMLRATGEGDDELRLVQG